MPPSDHNGWASSARFLSPLPEPCMKFSLTRLSPRQSAGHIPPRHGCWRPAPATCEAPRPRSGLGRCLIAHLARGPSLRRVMLSTPITATTTSSDFRSALHHFPEQPVISVATSRSTPDWRPGAIYAGAETDLPRSVPNCAYVPIPIRRRVPRCCPSKVFAPSMAFARVRGARLPHWSAFAGTITTLTQDSSSYGPYACSPPKQATLSWGFDSRVSPSIAHQLHGCLVITMTGLSPASSTQLRGTPNA
jgi:hypothetical protein